GRRPELNEQADPACFLMLAREPPFLTALHGYLCSLEKQLRFHALDSWRGLCAVLVAPLHYRAIWHLHEFPLIRNSYLFVDFFFVLSCFVIAHAYGDRIGDMADFSRFV